METPGKKGLRKELQTADQDLTPLFAIAKMLL
jgi:hypothetical protein